MQLSKRTLLIHHDCLGTAPLPDGHQEIIRDGLLALQQKKPKTRFTVAECDLVAKECLFSEFDFSSPYPVRKHAVRYKALDKSIRAVSSAKTSAFLLHPEHILPKWHAYYASAHLLDEIAREQQFYQGLSAQVSKSEWLAHLKKSGLSPVGLWDPVETEIRKEDRVCKLDCPGCCLSYQQQLPVARHRTAITRKTVSGPIRQALQDGVIAKNTTVLDYGCGKGEDVNHLQALGVTATGWDPVYHPQGKLEPADVVNLGFVLNVIEDPAERLNTLVKAYALAKSVLIVSAQIGAAPRSTESHGDGVLTQWGTFQKYFTQRELRYYIESSLGLKGQFASIGVFYVFHQKAALQRKKKSVLPVSSKDLQTLGVGKVLPDAIYIHVSALTSLPSSLQQIVNTAAEAIPGDTLYNILKISRYTPRISFLWYPDFDTEPQPVLRSTFVVDLKSLKVVRTIQYAGVDAWILHRKHLLVMENYRYYDQFIASAKQEESVLAQANAPIGRKSQWDKHLHKCSVETR